MNKSESITKLASALCKVQSEIVDATKDKSGDRGKYKYADLGQLLNLIRPVITKYGLSVSQFPCEAVDSDSVAVETVLMHESGEWISNKFSMKLHKIVTKDGRDVTNAPQAAGSVITYARRYALAAVIGITQEDDDAQQNREQKLKKANRDHSKAIATFCNENDQAQRDILWAMMDEDQKTAINNHINNGA